MPAAKVVISNKSAAELIGKTIGECFPDNALGEAVWTGALRKSDSYDSSYELSIEDAAAIVSCPRLVVDVYQTTDFSSGGISNLPSLDILVVRAHNSAQIEVGLGGLSLSSLYTRVDNVQALSFSGDDVRIREFDIAPYSQTDYSLQSLSFGEGVDIGSLSASDLHEVSELKLPSSLNSLRLANLDNLTQVDLASWENLQSLSLRAVGIDAEDGLQLDLSHNTQLRSVMLTSLNLSGGLSCQALSQLESVDFRFLEGLSELDLSQNHALTNVYLSSLGLEKIAFADDAALTSLNLENNKLTELVIPQAAQLEDLSVSENNLTTLTIPENSKTTLKELYAYHNKFASLDLSGMKLDWCLLKEADAAEPGQEPSFKGVLQKDGTVTVDLSDLAANIMSVDLGSKGRYDAETGILTFNSKDAANAGFSYIYDTKGTFLGESGSDYVPVYMDVAAHVELEGSLPGGGDSQGGSGGGDSQGGSGGSDPQGGSDGSGLQGGSGSASNDDNSIQQALVATGDKLVISGLLVCAAAAGVVLFIARRKIS